MNSRPEKLGLTVPLENGDYEKIILDEGLAATIAQLPSDPKHCFKTARDEIWLPLSNLRNTRVRHKSVANAADYMLAACRGEIEARDPISVRRLRDGVFAVVDGNSSVVIALAANWSSIPATIE